MDHHLHLLTLLVSKFQTRTCLTASEKNSLCPQVNTSDIENLGAIVELWFIFSLIWSICASVDEDGRKKMDNFLREMDGTFPIKVLCRAVFPKMSALFSTQGASRNVMF